MDIKEIKELIELINSSDLAFFEYKCSDSHIKMDKSLTRGINSQKEVVKEDKVVRELPVLDKQKEELTEKVIENKVEKIESFEDLTIVTSPMVGTFYGSPSPDSGAFISEGQKVKCGDVLCIVEAMKLMNEIESEVNGIVVEVLLKDGEMAEYGTPLFKIKEEN